MTKPPITHHQSPILIIGFGNLFRSDDAVGIHVAQKLKEQKLPNVTVVEESCEPVSLIDEWKHRDLVIIVDAVSSGATAGTVHKLDASSQKIPAKYFRHSTHAVSIAEAIELARTLGTLPPQLIVYGIEGKNFSAGTELTPEVRHAADKVVKAIFREVSTVA